MPRARHTREQVRTVPTWTLGYDGSDPLARLLAERIALNAKDAGLSAATYIGGRPPILRLLRIPLVRPIRGLRWRMWPRSRARPWEKKALLSKIYTRSELALLATQRLIPLFHLPVSYAASANLKNWALRPTEDGLLQMHGWIGNGKTACGNHDRHMTFAANFWPFSR